VVHLVNMVMKVLCNDSSSCLDFMASGSRRMNKVVHRRRGTDRAKLNNVQEMCPTATSSTINPTWTDPDSKPGRRDIRLRPKCKQYKINSLPSVSRKPQERRFFFLQVPRGRLSSF
jgi:hypothetical protein